MSVFCLYESNLKRIANAVLLLGQKVVVLLSLLLVITKMLDTLQKLKYCCIKLV